MTVIKIEKCVEYPGKKEPETHYYISSLSLKNYSAKQLLEVIIKHWSVETLHGVLDNSLNEDKCKIYRDNAPEILSIFRKLAVNIIIPYARFYPDVSYVSVLNLLKLHIEFLDEVLTKDSKAVGSPNDWRMRQGKNHLQIACQK
jgi:hypothetical protein